MLEPVRHHVDRLMALDAEHAPKDRSMVVHVCYYRLVDAFETVMPEVFTALDLAWTPEVEERVRAWRAHNPKGRRGVDDYGLDAYGLDDYGLDRASSAEAFAEYTERFIITSEQVLTRWVTGPVGPSSDGVR